MHKNTFLLITFLAIVAALLVGFNLGKKYNPPAQEPTPQSISPTPVPIQHLPYTNTRCGISFLYPNTATFTETSSQSAQLVFANENPIVMVCDKEIPGVAIPEENIEKLTIASVSATLYHTDTPKDGTPIDIVLFKHPKTGMTVFLSGLGSSFTALIESITLAR